MCITFHVPLFSFGSSFVPLFSHFCLSCRRFPFFFSPLFLLIFYFYPVCSLPDWSVLQSYQIYHKVVLLVVAVHRLGRFVAGSISASVRHYYVIAGVMDVFDTDHSARLLSARVALPVPFCVGVHDTVIGVWKKCWKHWGRRGALQRKAACQEMD